MPIPPSLCGMIRDTIRPTRRAAIQAGGLALLSGTLGGAAPAERPRRILLRSSWQTINIGDIAHTPGLLATLERYLPDVDVTLWPSRIDHGVDDMLRRRFPRLRIAADRAAVDAAFADCDLLLHGSGPSLVAEKDVARWRDATGKPFGVYGITLPRTASTSTVPASREALARTIDLLGDAKFVYFRDSASLALARELGCGCPVMEFGPDGAFGTDLRDDGRAAAFLAAHGLTEGKFLCCIPRLRYTPEWSIPEKKKPFEPTKHARNEAMREHDHAPLREAITRVVRETGLKVLVCPEDRTQMAVGRERLVERLPEDVRRSVVWRPDYWLTDEALSTYVKSAGLFGNEMHSPIMCIGNGVPAIVCRFAEQTSKGLMWRDIGLGDWLFDLDDEADVRRVAAVVVEMAKHPVESRQRAAAAGRFVEERQRAAMQTITAVLAGGESAREKRVATVTQMPGLVAFWDFIAREPDGDRRFVAHVPAGSPTDYPLDAGNYVRDFWGEGREATYADFPLLGRGPFGEAIRIRKEEDPTFRPFLFVPRSRLHDMPLDIKGEGTSVTVVVWAVRESGNHALAGIWHEGTDLHQDSTQGIRRVERGQRQYALFAGLNKEGSACGHVSENGASSFLNRYALHKCNSAAVAAAVPADAPPATLDAGWHCFAMTFDHDRNEITGWLDGQAGDRWLDNPQKDGLLSFAANAWLQGRLQRQEGMQEGEDPAFPATQCYNPPEDEPVAVDVVSRNDDERVELRQYPFTKVRVTLRRSPDGGWQETGRALAALRLNPWWYPHGIYTPPDATSGGPFTIGRVIHSSRSVGFTGWIGGVAVFDRPLSAAELGRLAALANVAATPESTGP